MCRMIVPYDMVLNIEEITILRFSKECTFDDAIIAHRYNDKLRKKIYLIESSDNDGDVYKLNAGEEIHVKSFREENPRKFFYDYIFIEKEEYNILLYYYNWRFSYISCFLEESDMNKKITNAYQFRDIKLPSILGAQCKYCQVIDCHTIKLGYYTKEVGFIYGDKFETRLKEYLSIIMSDDSITIKSIDHKRPSFPTLGCDGEIHFNTSILVNFNEESTICDVIGAYELMGNLLLDNRCSDYKFVDINKYQKDIIISFKDCSGNYRFYTIKLDDHDCINDICKDNKSIGSSPYIGMKLYNE